MDCGDAMPPIVAGSKINTQGHASQNSRSILRSGKKYAELWKRPCSARWAVE
jgi:hypothetical protein